MYSCASNDLSAYYIIIWESRMMGVLTRQLLSEGLYSPTQYINIDDRALGKEENCIIFDKSSSQWNAENQQENIWINKTISSSDKVYERMKQDKSHKMKRGLHMKIQKHSSLRETIIRDLGFILGVMREF